MTWKMAVKRPKYRGYVTGLVEEVLIDEPLTPFEHFRGCASAFINVRTWLVELRRYHGVKRYLFMLGH